MNLKLNYEITNDLDFLEEDKIFEEDAFISFERDVEKVMSLLYSNLVDLSIEDKHLSSIYGKAAIKERFYFKLVAVLMQEENYDRYYFEYIKEFTRHFVNEYSGEFKDTKFIDMYCDLRMYLSDKEVEIPNQYRRRNEVKQLLASFHSNENEEDVLYSITLLNHYFNVCVLDRFMDSQYFDLNKADSDNITAYLRFTANEREEFNLLLNNEVEAVRHLIKSIVLKPIFDNLEERYYDMAVQALDSYIADNSDDLVLEDVDVAILLFGRTALADMLNTSFEETTLEQQTGMRIRH